MLKNTNALKGLLIRATDGDLGAVDEFYFDDETWAIRYLTVTTGGWLGGRSVLISPRSIIHTDWHGHCLDVALTKRQVENSPPIDTHKPVSRQQDATYVAYYNHPTDLVAEMIARESPDSQLRSSEAVTGYYMDAVDGEIGHLEGFIVDDQNWVIRYIEVATRNWLPGKRVLVAPAWIERVSWEDSKVYVGLTREAIRSGPEYAESHQPITREYEHRLYMHYGRPPYWIQVERESSLAMASA
jgi:hypothetical protein